MTVNVESFTEDWKQLDNYDKQCIQDYECAFARAGSLYPFISMLERRRTEEKDSSSAPSCFMDRIL